MPCLRMHANVTILIMLHAAICTKYSYILCLQANYIARQLHMVTILPNPLKLPPASTLAYFDFLNTGYLSSMRPNRLLPNPVTYILAKKQ